MEGLPQIVPDQQIGSRTAGGPLRPHPTDAHWRAFPSLDLDSIRLGMGRLAGGVEMSG